MPELTPLQKRIRERWTTIDPSAAPEDARGQYEVAMVVDGTVYLYDICNEAAARRSRNDLARALAKIVEAANAPIIEAAKELGRLWTVGAHLVDDSVVEKMDDLARTIRGDE